jgi:hypothetical protein
MDIQRAAELMFKHVEWKVLFTKQYWRDSPYAHRTGEHVRSMNLTWQEAWDAITVITGKEPEGWPLALCVTFGQQFGRNTELDKHINFLISFKHPLSVPCFEYPTVSVHPWFSSLESFYEIAKPHYYRHKWVYPILQHGTVRRKETSVRMIRYLIQECGIEYISMNPFSSVKEAVIKWLPSLLILFTRFGFPAASSTQTGLRKFAKCDQLRQKLYEIGVLRLEDQSFLNRLVSKEPFIGHIDLMKVGRGVHVNVLSWTAQYQSFVDALLGSGALLEEE